ncbi:MAG: hypothetical protein ACRBBK_01615 [Paracoccaceae bacterium]
MLPALITSHATEIGSAAVLLMVASYALERRHPAFILSFAIGCAMAAFYAYLIGSWLFVIAEGLWAIIAFARYLKAR